MRNAVIPAVLANLRGRSTTMLTLLIVLGVLSGGVLAVAIPAFDARDNAARLYSSPAWASTHVVLGSRDADGPMDPDEAAALATLPGVRHMQTDHVATVEAAGEHVTVHSVIDALEVPVVRGRAPAEGACEWAVHRDSPLADRLGGGLDVQGLDDGHVSIVGVFPRGFPFFEVSEVLSTCRTGGPSGDEQYYVTTADGDALPDRYVSSTLAERADAVREASQSTGVLGLVTLVVSVITLGVAWACARWSVVSRRREFAVLQVQGVTRGQVLTMVLLEQLAVSLAAVPLGVLIGWAGAWTLLARAGQSGLVDPSEAWRAAVPSLPTVGFLTAGVVAVVLAASLLASARILRHSVSALLRRRGE